MLEWNSSSSLQGRWKRPDSYRGITLTSVVAKVLEFLILGRMDGLLLEAHINQTAYRKKTSCADTISATLEVISRYPHENSKNDAGFQLLL